MNFLARELRKQQADLTIQVIQDPSSKQLCSNPEDIQRVLKTIHDYIPKHK